MKRFYYFIMLMMLVLIFSMNTPAQQNPPAHQDDAAKPAQSPKVNDQDAFKEAVRIKDPAEKLVALKKFLADRPDSPFNTFIKIQIFKTLLATGAPEKEFLPFAEEGVNGFPNIPQKSQVLNDVAYTLAEAGKGLELAQKYAEQALSLLPAEAGNDERAGIQDTLGWVQFKRGNYPEAVKNLELSVKVAEDPDSFEHMAKAYEKTGQSEKAIDMLVTAVALTGEEGEAHKTRLEALKTAYIKKNGSDRGLDERINEKRVAMLKETALVKSRYEGPAPEWQLKSLKGDPLNSADLKGKVVVLDWWGSWCPPCRLELPHFQKLYESYKDKGVIFVGMNWEQPNAPAEARIAAANKFLVDNKYTFPNANDHEMAAGDKYKIEVFPTVFIIGRDGQIRYRTLGYSPNVAEIIEMQIKSELTREAK